MNKLERSLFWKILAKIQRAVIMITAVGSTVIVAAACLLRVVKINLIGYEEILVIVAFWLYMIGSSYGSYEKSQITADILDVLMPENLVKGIIRVIRSILTLALGVVFLYWAWGMVMWTVEMQTKTPVWRIPVTVGQGSIFVGLLLITFYNAVYMYDDIKGFVNGYIRKVEPPVQDAQESSN